MSPYKNFTTSVLFYIFEVVVQTLAVILSLTDKLMTESVRFI